MVRAVYISGAFLPLYLLLSLFLAIVLFTVTYGHHTKGVPEEVTYIVEHLQPDTIRDEVWTACAWVANGTAAVLGEKLDALLHSRAGRVGQFAVTSGAVTASYTTSFAMGVGRFLGRKAMGIYEELAPRPLTWLLVRLWGGGWAAGAALKTWWDAAKPAWQEAAYTLLRQMALGDTVAAYIAMAASLLLGCFFSFCVILVPAKRFIRNAFLEELRIFEERLGQHIRVQGVRFSVRKSEMEVTDVLIGNPRQFTYMAGFLLKANSVRLHLRRFHLIFGCASTSRFVVHRAVLQYKPGMKAGSSSNVSVVLDNVREIQKACGIACVPPPGALDEKTRDSSRSSFEIHVPCVVEDSEFTGTTEIMCSVLEQTLEECMATWAHQRLLSFDEAKAQKEKGEEPEAAPAAK